MLEYDSWYLHDQVREKRIDIKKCKGTENPSNRLTKALTDRELQAELEVLHMRREWRALNKI